MTILLLYFLLISLTCLQEILVFQQDRSADVRRFVVGFIEEAW